MTLQTKNKYTIICEYSPGVNKYWHSCNAWVDSIEQAEVFDDSDIDKLIPHFMITRARVAAIPSNTVFKGWHMTHYASVEPKEG